MKRFFRIRLVLLLIAAVAMTFITAMNDINRGMAQEHTWFLYMAFAAIQSVKLALWQGGGDIGQILDRAKGRFNLTH